MRAPSAARRRATARPMRRPAPVTRATCPESFTESQNVTQSGAANPRRPAKLATALGNRRSSMRYNRAARTEFEPAKAHHSVDDSGRLRRSSQTEPFGRFRGGGAMKLDLLAMAAHPDDVELTCGGTLIKTARQGYAVGILDLTGGEMGTRGSLETRRKEAAAAARILGVAHRENLGLPDAHLEMRMEYKL